MVTLYFTYNAITRLLSGLPTLFSIPDNFITDTKIINLFYSVENDINLLFALKQNDDHL